MVAAPAIEVRPVGPDAFDEILPLLELFENPKMGRDDWRSMLFDYPWSTEHPRGFALYSGGKPVGFMGTIVSRRRIAGRDEFVCNASSWIVEPAFRYASTALLRPLLGMRDCTILNLTPTQRTRDVFGKLGFRVLETEQLLLAPVGSPASLFGGTFSNDPRTFASELDPDEQAISRALLDVPRATQLLVRRGDRRAFFVATPLRVKKLPLAEIQYAGDHAFLWEHRALVHAALLRSMGAIGIAIDRRFAPARLPAFVVRRPQHRLYRPVQRDAPPVAFDGLFSELMTVRI